MHALIIEDEFLVAFSIEKSHESNGLTNKETVAPEDKAIKSAVKRGVAVRTLIAHTNSGGEKGLRKLEQRLLAISIRRRAFGFYPAV